MLLLLSILALQGSVHCQEGRRGRARAVLAPAPEAEAEVIQALAPISESIDITPVAEGPEVEVQVTLPSGDAASPRVVSAIETAFTSGAPLPETVFGAGVPAPESESVAAGLEDLSGRFRALLSGYPELQEAAAGAATTQSFLSATCTVESGTAIVVGALEVQGEFNSTFWSEAGTFEALDIESTATGLAATFNADEANCTVTNGTVTLTSARPSNLTLSWNGTVRADGPASYQTPNGTVSSAGTSQYEGSEALNVVFEGILDQAFGSGSVEGSDYTVSAASISCSGSGVLYGNGTVTGPFAATGTGVGLLSAGSSVNGTGTIYFLGAGSCEASPGSSDISVVILQ